MADVQDLSTMTLAFKKQTGLDLPAAGAGAFGLEVLPSTGLAVAIGAIESAMIKKNRMKRRPRHGPKSVTSAYETELSVGPCDPIFGAVLGTNVVAPQSFSNTDWGALSIALGTDTATLTFASGTIITDGIAAGMYIKLAGTSVSGNNGKWIPILEATEGTMVVPKSYVAVDAASATWTATIAGYYATPSSYVDTYWSVEEYLSEASVAASKYATDMRFHGLNFSIEPKGYVRIGTTLTGRDMKMLNATTTPTAPAFTSPTFISGDSLIPLDGGIYVNGKRRLDLTGLKFGIAAPASTTDVIGTNLSPDISLGQYAFTGDFTGVVANSDDFESFDAEDDIALMLHCKRKRDEGFVGIYVGYASFGGYSTPMGGEGLLTQSIQLFGGEDEQTDHLPTTILISTATS